MLAPQVFESVTGMATVEGLARRQTWWMVERYSEVRTEVVAAVTSSVQREAQRADFSFPPHLPTTKDNYKTLNVSVTARRAPAPSLPPSEARTLCALSGEFGQFLTMPGLAFVCSSFVELEHICRTETQRLCSRVSPRADLLEGWDLAVSSRPSASAANGSSQPTSRHLPGVSLESLWNVPGSAALQTLSARVRKGMALFMVFDLIDHEGIIHVRT
ncbi:hypothetical protein CALCODRAFT_187796 [Calocera cornea HHB12733]|uniref:Uncharacterized protein n=1 Tax=Calocera cornea HHB12733 TaxID=1353952 RepID=A0A165HQA6_9BASI|nr:hypothetical protein CALCODRAFT_187796 [Calocera cornea HHB12733]